MRSDPPLSDERLEASLAVVNSRLSAELSTKDMARAAGLSEFHFSRAFKKSTGQSPYAYIIARRIEAAKVLLGEGRLPIVQVAAAVGYTTQAHFTGAFRQHTGTTPKVYRDGFVARAPALPVGATAEFAPEMVPHVVDQPVMANA